MDAMTRVFIERSIEAIFDAGLSPADLRGTHTAVFCGSSISETEMFTLDSSKTAAFSMLGRSRTMLANRVSYILNLSGILETYNDKNNIVNYTQKTLIQAPVTQRTEDGFVAQTL